MLDGPTPQWGEMMPARDSHQSSVGFSDGRAARTLLVACQISCLLATLHVSDSLKIRTIQDIFQEENGTNKQTSEQPSITTNLKRQHFHMALAPITEESPHCQKLPSAEERNTVYSNFQRRRRWVVI